MCTCCSKLCDDGNADVDVTASLRSTLKILVSNGRYSFTAEGTSVSVSNLDIDIGGTWLRYVQRIKAWNTFISFCLFVYQKGL